MYCNDCGQNNPEHSKFCQQCGAKVSKSDSEQQSNETEQVEEKNIQPVAQTAVDLLWEKFAEVYDAEDKDRERFDALSSSYIWELQERLSVNAFESFIEENKEELNKQPYKSIETLKNVYTWTVLGGYRLWLAEALLNDKEELNKFKSFSLEKFIEKWKEYDFDKALKELSEEMGICITKYSNFRLNSFLDGAQEAKELPNATIEKLKTSLLLLTLNGYHAGKIENSFRK